MGFYKFLHTKDISKYTNEGSIRFRRLKYYRLLEVATGDQWIGDRAEGLSVTRINTEVSPSNPNPDAKRWLKDAGIADLGDTSNSIVIKNATLTREYDCFIFSFSKGNVDELTSAMCDPQRLYYAYDACLKIRDPVSLCEALRKDGLVNGKPLADHFAIHLGQVNYGKMEHDFSAAGVAPADPLLKDDRFKAQSEFRLILAPKETVIGDDVTVSLQSAASFFSEISRNILPLPPKDATLIKKSEAELIHELQEALGFIKNYFGGGLHDATARSVRQEALEEEFDRNWRLRLAKAWFELRCIRPSDKMDRAITTSYKVVGMRTRLEDYLSGDHSGPGPTPLQDPTFP